MRRNLPRSARPSMKATPAALPKATHLRGSGSLSNLPRRSASRGRVSFLSPCRSRLAQHRRVYEPGIIPPEEMPAIVGRGLRDELGLKLESRKSPIPTLVIDHAEKVPTGN